MMIQGYGKVQTAIICWILKTIKRHMDAAGLSADTSANNTCMLRAYSWFTATRSWTTAIK